MTAEAKLERQARFYAQKHKVRVYKFVSPGRRGVPDRLFIKRGRMLFLEFKAPGKKPTELQRRELAILNEEEMPAFWTDNLRDACDMIDDFLLSMS